jgi:hypothetical protein
MTESRPPEFEQARQLHRMLTEKVLDKACSDPQWRQQLIEDPEMAMREANFPEAQQFLETRSPSAEAEVGGHGGGGLPGGSHPWWQCHYGCAGLTVLWEYTHYEDPGQRQS